MDSEDLNSSPHTCNWTTLTSEDPPCCPKPSLFFEVLVMEFRAFCVPVKYSTTELYC